MQNLVLTSSPLLVPEVLPPDTPYLHATRPPQERDGVRLLVSRGADVEQSTFSRLADHVQPGDLWVVNDSETLPAALHVDRVTLHLSTCLSGYRRFWFSGRTRWVVEPRRRESQAGERWDFPDGASVQLIKPYADSIRLWEAWLDVPLALAEWLSRVGRAIRYDYVPEDHGLDQYQTMFARRLGSAEMPSAGRPFTPAVVASMQNRGAQFATITLHTGVASGESHEPPYAEYFEVSLETAAAVHHAREVGGRVVAVGTTVVRALESAPGGGCGWTDRVISPHTGVYAVDGLLTGLHEPRASHLAMLAAFTAPDNLRTAYRTAVDNGYLWHEFGDSHLLLS
jgi:S-adenosylmethionine:tRNA ribosyltransferase-isomerase